jgi:serine/threonine-protein kinase
MAHTPSPPGQEGRSAPLGPFQAPQIAAAQRRFWLTIDAMLVALVVVAVVGGWAYAHVRGSLRDLRSAGLLTLLEAEARGVGIWIEEKERDAERWASTPAVQREGAALARLAAGGDVCASAQQRGLRDEIAPYAAVEEISAFNLIARDGRIVSSPMAEYCGLEVSAQFLRRLAPVFEGKTVFVPPLAESDRIPAAGARALEGPFAWVETPVRGPDGSVVAALGFGRRPAERFARLLAPTVEGTSRDAYAFDEQARLLTQPRYASVAPGAAVRDPAGSLTRIAEAAVAHRDASEGVILEPYSNYRGAEVIGAWRWLASAGLGVAVEVEAAEAYGPLEYLQIAFGVLLALVLVSMTAAASTSLWAARMGLREAKRVGQYRLEREIGAGGMSNVYLARHALLRRPAAVKVLKAHLATDEAVARFQREAQLCSQLAHPNTVEIYDYGTTRDGRWYYAMEYLNGISLQDLVREHGPMPVARVVHMLRQACGSLREVHAHGLVHRDVKPANIMLCERAGLHDVVKILDFGIVKETRNPDTRDITQYSKVLGTPLFMAPERLRNPADADARADIYALGAVAYFALAGRPAFEAQTDHDIVYRVLNDSAPTLAAGGAHEVPPDLEALVAQCLAKDRAGRPPDIDAVRAVLDTLAAREPWSEAQARAWWEAHGPVAGAPV